MQEFFIRGMMAAENESRKARASNMKLGQLISVLEGLEPTKPVITDGGQGVGGISSYRGYYEDLALVPCETPGLGAGELLETLRQVMGRSLEGYKGGEFQMHEKTLLWVSPYGEASGHKVSAVEYGPASVLIETEEEGWQ